MPYLPSNLFGPRYELPPNHHIGKPLQDPFGPLTTIRLPIPGETPIVVNKNLEWKETPLAHVYKAHLPGLRHNEVRVEVENNRELCISGEKWVERETRSGRGLLVERVRSRFIQRLMLPQNSNVQRVKAWMENNGLLIVSVPKY
ncbi:18.1 kDa class I heat shock protein-like [Abrus precatorius]|uniref:18.1 kDa class I heat shock protein-like n=1 Tax=Abrus precatorius TaxID=3816 RepID=A0A8B8K185_ABRPR|nr:18.1 kDa class I heat shock protein-like [Abrus precatorius]